MASRVCGKQEPSGGNLKKKSARRVCSTIMSNHVLTVLPPELVYILASFAPFAVANYVHADRSHYARFGHDALLWAEAAACLQLSKKGRMRLRLCAPALLARFPSLARVVPLPLRGCGGVFEFCLARRLLACERGGEDDSAIIIFDVETLLRVGLINPDQYVRAATFSPSGTLLACGVPAKKSYAHANLRRALTRQVFTSTKAPRGPSCASFSTLRTTQSFFSPRRASRPRRTTLRYNSGP